MKTIRKKQTGTTVHLQRLLRRLDILGTVRIPKCVPVVRPTRVLFPRFPRGQSFACIPILGVVTAQSYRVLSDATLTLTPS